MIGGALEVSVGAQDRREGAQFGAHGLVERDDAEALLLEEDFLAVDLVLDEREVVVGDLLGAGKTRDAGVEEIDDAPTLVVEPLGDPADLVR